MAINFTPQEIIASALQLPVAEREQVVDALQDSLIDDTLDHGPHDAPEEVQTAWSEEIAHRLADIDAGRVTTIPAEEAERMIRADVRIAQPLAGPLLDDGEQFSLIPSSCVTIRISGLWLELNPYAEGVTSVSPGFAARAAYPGSPPF